MPIGNSGSGSETKKKIFNVALNQETNSELTELAAMLDKSKAEIVRLALRMFRDATDNKS
jgi:hypothetical protein